jgi:hypothetical protein
MIWFLVRITFWLSVILVLLPSGGSQPDSRSQVGVGEAISAAKAAVGDMQQFCDRQPEACTIGSSAAVTIRHRAEAGAKMLYELLTDQLPPRETGSLPARGPLSRDTLTPADLRPPWRGPQPHREPRIPPA